MKKLTKAIAHLTLASVAAMIFIGCSGGDDGAAENPTEGKMIPEAVPATQGGDGGTSTTQTKGTPP